jgi:hypothetical protein
MLRDKHPVLNSHRVEKSDSDQKVDSDFPTDRSAPIMGALPPRTRKDLNIHTNVYGELGIVERRHRRIKTFLPLCGR